MVTLSRKFESLDGILHTHIECRCSIIIIYFSVETPKHSLSKDPGPEDPASPRLRRGRPGFGLPLEEGAWGLGDFRLRLEYWPPARRAYGSERNMGYGGTRNPPHNRKSACRKLSA